MELTSVPELRSCAGADWLGEAHEAPDLNPARPAELVAKVWQADKEIAVAAVEAADRAFSSWRSTPAPARGEILRKAAHILEDRAELVSREFTREEGKTFPEALAETKRAIAILRYFGSQTLEPVGEVYPSHSSRTLLYSIREPLGVVAVITPWNFPIAIPAWKIAPALAYGNTVVWKPAELTPLTAYRLTEVLFDAGLPMGVLNLVLGKGSVVGSSLVGHRRVRAVSFTGSGSVGKHIERQAHVSGAKVQLELGGKNPAIVLRDADLDLAAQQVARGAFLSAGQKCTATSRVIVEDSIYDAFMSRLVAITSNMRVGDPLLPDTAIGPVVSRQAMESILGFIDAARLDGGRVLAGGRAAESRDDGYFIEPTIIDSLPSASSILHEEIFGPVAAVVRVASYQDAVEASNDSHYGLAASLFTRDLNAAMRFAREAQVGVVKVNQETAGIEYQAPFGGFKESSNGSREQGKVARDFYTQIKTVYMDQGD